MRDSVGKGNVVTLMRRAERTEWGHLSCLGSRGSRYSRPVVVVHLRRQFFWKKKPKIKHSRSLFIYLLVVNGFQIVNNLSVTVSVPIYCSVNSLTLPPDLRHIRHRRCQPAIVRKSPQKRLQLSVPLQQQLPTPLVVCLRVFQSFLQLRGVSPLGSHRPQGRSDPFLGGTLGIPPQLDHLKWRKHEIPPLIALEPRGPDLLPGRQYLICSLYDERLLTYT